MSKSTPLSKALSLWEEKNEGKPASEAEEIKLCFLVKAQHNVDSTHRQVGNLSFEHSHSSRKTLYFFQCH